MKKLYLILLMTFNSLNVFADNNLSLICDGELFTQVEGASKASKKYFQKSIIIKDNKLDNSFSVLCSGDEIIKCDGKDELALPYGGGKWIFLKRVTIDRVLGTVNDYLSISKPTGTDTLIFDGKCKKAELKF